MTDLMHRELMAVAYMVIAGMSVMMVYQSGKYLLERIKGYKRLYIILYLLFWITVGYIFSQYMYEATYGLIFWYTLPAFAAGCILWKKLFCGILNLYKTAQNYNGDKVDDEKNKRAS